MHVKYATNSTKKNLVNVIIIIVIKAKGFSFLYCYTATVNQRYMEEKKLIWFTTFSFYSFYFRI